MTPHTRPLSRKGRGAGEGLKLCALARVISIGQLPSFRPDPTGPACHSERSEESRSVLRSEMSERYRPAKAHQSGIGGNESFPEIPTYPSHNKWLNPLQFVRSKMAYPVESKGDTARSSFKSFVVNVGSHRPAFATISGCTHGKHRHVCATHPRSQSAMLR